MKKIFYLLALALCTAQFQACSSDDEPTPNDLEQNYLSIENAVYSDGDFPAATTPESLDGIDMSSQVMNGAMNYVTLTTDKNVRKFFVGIKNVAGYWTYEPPSARDNSAYHTYVIPVMISQNYSDSATLVLSGELEDGSVTTPVEKALTRIDTREGAIEIKLAFSNSKDVDLHLFLPDGDHIYYGNRGYTLVTENGDTLSYGLDIDSNAGCRIDDINKENIYIPEELVDTGTYRVVVDMYSNCYPSTPTSWSIVARYRGELLTPLTGVNPASGLYPEGAGNDDMTEVMTFRVKDAPAHAPKAGGLKASRKPLPLSDMGLLKKETAPLR